MPDVLLLSSGGLDSTTLAYWLRAQDTPFQPLFFNYGQHCAETEWQVLNTVLPAGANPPRRIDISDIYRGARSRLIKEPDLWSDPVTDSELYIPYRTLLFLSVAAAYAQSHHMSEVHSGFINSNHAKELDCSSAFLNGLDALAAGVGPVRFQFPFREKSKKDVVALALQLNVPIGRTYSCQVYSDVPCGACPNCVERLEALKQLGLIR